METKAHDIRRLKQKLKLMEQEGIGQLLVEFHQHLVRANPDMKQPHWMQQVVSGFKRKLENDLQQVQDNIKGEQGKLL